MSRPPDITIADFWEIEKYAPEFAEKKSFSLVIVNTEKGKEVFKQIEDNIEYNQRTMSEALEKNPQLERSIKVNKEKREKFWKEYNKKKISYIIKKYGRCNIISKIKK